ncbi:citryl-CoA lyase [Nocardioides plantarum]|uniref:citrate synthase (unknown stereospecificity) n=1 Tax=Nocardioides plantarum TaxID=29299 RepID=A0ABV5KDT5_9ACTN|nr:citryl-CoA lyase [Nocardioides plantarum]
MSSNHEGYPTSLGVSTVDTISLMGRDLSADLIGKVDFGDLAYQLITLREPTAGQAAMFNAVLVALADHGFTPTAIAARLTWLSAPDAIQGALAAGLLGGGSRFLGVSEDTGTFLADALAVVDGQVPTDDIGWDALATSAIQQRRKAGGFVPGLGHHLHKNGDPRVARLLALAQEHGTYGPHLALFAAMGRVAPDVLGKRLPLNGAGACGAVLADLDVPLPMLRGVVLLARCAGLLGQLAEEMRTPIASRIFTQVEAAAEYLPIDHDGPTQA